MNFALDDDQRSMQDGLARLLAAEMPLARLQAALQDGEAPAAAGDGPSAATRATVAGSGPVAALHAAVAGAGWHGVLVPTIHGGAGLGLLDAALAAEAFGRAAAPVPFVASAGIVALALARYGSAAQRERWLPALADGSVVAAAALSEAAAGRAGDVAGVDAADGMLAGEASFALDADAAGLFLVADRQGRLHLVERGQTGLAVEPLHTLDRTRGLATLRFANCAAQPLGDGGDGDGRDPGRAGADGTTALATLIAVGRLLLAADTLGAASAMLDAAVAYARVRTQFGQPIGAFQAVKHLCADMAAQLVPCRAYLWGTAQAFDADPARSITACAQLKAHLSEVGQTVARGATEVHGGMGFTELLGLHLLYKRLALSRQLLGGPTRLRAEAAAALFGAPAREDAPCNP